MANEAVSFKAPQCEKGGGAAQIDVYISLSRATLSGRLVDARLDPALGGA
jgi:hypothetical protein